MLKQADAGWLRGGGGGFGSTNPIHLVWPLSSPALGDGLGRQ